MNLMYKITEELMMMMMVETTMSSIMMQTAFLSVPAMTESVCLSF